MRFKIFLLSLIFLASLSIIQTTGVEIGEDETLITAEIDDKITAVYGESAKSELFSKNLITTSLNPAPTNECYTLVEAQRVLVEHLLKNDGIFEINSESRWPIASITKLMSAVVVLENTDSNKEISVSKTAAEAEGNGPDFKEGEIFKAGDLLKAALMSSSNKAIIALAESFGIDNFVRLMRQKAKDLQMNETFFAEPTGLSPSDQSTPRDIKKLILYIYDNRPEIFSMTRQKSAEIVNLKNRQKKLLININQFAGDTSFVGGKTGYIEDAGANLVSVFSVNGRLMYVAVFGAKDRFAETRKILECF